MNLINQPQDVESFCRACNEDALLIASCDFTYTCSNCGARVSAMGQKITYPRGQGEDYAGERWDDDY